MGLFDEIEEVSNVRIEAKAEKRKIKQTIKFSARNENLHNILKNVGGLPANDEMVNFVSDGTSDTGGFFSEILREFGNIDEMFLSTWTISRENVLRILEAYDQGRIGKFEFLINNGLLKTNSTKAIWGLICDEFTKRGIKYRAVNSHAKIFCVKCGDRFITVSGSGNWSENPRIENYFIIGGEETFSFNKKWMQELIISQ